MQALLPRSRFDDVYSRWRAYPGQRNCWSLARVGWHAYSQAAFAAPEFATGTRSPAVCSRHHWSLWIIGSTKHLPAFGESPAAYPRPVCVMLCWCSLLLRITCSGDVVAVTMPWRSVADYFLGNSVGAIESVAAAAAPLCAGNASDWSCLQATSALYIPPSFWEGCLHRRRIVTWLILPVVICLSQRLSHACLSISNYTVKLRMAH